MGDDDDAPAAPDYGPLIEAMTKSSNISNERAKEMFDWAKNAYNENKATSDIFTDKALGEMDKQIADSDRYRQRLQNIFEPLEDQLAWEAENYASPERQEFEAGKAEANVAAQVQQARQTAADRLEAFGVDPSQLRQGALDLGTRVAEASMQANAGNAARAQTEQIGRDLRTQAINVGRGYPATVTGSSQTGTAAGTAGVNSGLATTASGAQTMGTGTQWTGLGNQALASAANIQNMGYQNKLGQWQADQSSSSGWGDVLGTVAGTALKFLPFEEGGAIPDPEYAQMFANGGGPIPQSASPSGGAIPDDVAMPIVGQSGEVMPSQLNAGEFVVPKDVVGWVGEKGMQQMIMKARKEMAGGDQTRPAQPEVGPAPGGSPQ